MTYALDRYNQDEITVGEMFSMIPDTLVTSINNVAHILLRDQSILDYLNGCNMESMKNDEKYVIMIITLLDNYNPLYIFDCKWKDMVLGYINPDNRGEYRYLRISDEIKINVSGKILKGFIQKNPIDDGSSLPVVIKCSYTSQLLHEMNIYRTLRNMGSPVPWFSVNYSYWGHPVLVMEPLDPIDYSDDDVRNIGRNIIEQLRYLHQIGVHCDIKPMNIMRKPLDKINNKDNLRTIRSKDKYYYYLIDYGGVTTDLISDDGEVRKYKRHTHTRMFSSQKRTFGSCTAYNDLIELGYTLNYVKWTMIDERKETVNNNFKSNFSGTLGKYMKYVRTLKNSRIDDEIYENIVYLFDGRK